MNIFSYVFGESIDFVSILDEWSLKAQEYINTYFEGDRENTRDTPFWDCVSKIQFLIDAIEFGDQGITINDMRGVVDDRQILQAIAAITEVELEYEGEKLRAIAIESLTNAPWNVIEYIQVETRKGAATSLVEEIVKESQSKQFGGVVKLFAIPRAKYRYNEIGFIETDGSGEMLLTRELAERFLANQVYRRSAQLFD
ncbi:hypothetical protein RIVM261_052410 [Rivularia sp. IAM M-261]|nr:hypothetical protein RIVM261_052410 [Rivularia sp. IAM M-261]